MPTSYIVSVDDVTMAPVSIVATTAMQYSYTFSGLRNDRLYTVTVVAVNCGGNSDPAYPTSGTCKHNQILFNVLKLYAMGGVITSFLLPLNLMKLESRL